MICRGSTESVTNRNKTFDGLNDLPSEGSEEQIEATYQVAQIGKTIFHSDILEDNTGPAPEFELIIFVPFQVRRLTINLSNQESAATQRAFEVKRKLKMVIVFVRTLLQ